MKRGFFGAQVAQVDEPLSPLSPNLFRSEPIFQAEFDVIAEPKALLPLELRALVKKYGGFALAAEAIGASEAFVRQTIQNKQRRRKGTEPVGPYSKT